MSQPDLAPQYCHWRNTITSNFGSHRRGPRYVIFFLPVLPSDRLLCSQCSQVHKQISLLALLLAFQSFWYFFWIAKPTKTRTVFSQVFFSVRSQRTKWNQIYTSSMNKVCSNEGKRTEWYENYSLRIIKHLCHLLSPFTTSPSLDCLIIKAVSTVTGYCTSSRIVCLFL